MKRDLDLIRAILLAIEQDPGRYSDPEVQGATEDELRGHVELLVDAGLVTPRPATPANKYLFAGHRLTWAGHEFLSTAREEKRWALAKKTGELAGGISFEVLTSVLSKLAAAAVGLPPS